VDAVSTCALEARLNYGVGLHVGAVFIILVASALGVAFKKLGIHPFIVIIGKCAGAGVILAVSLVHMLLPANDSLTSPCAPVVFNTDYGAYAFLFAMIAAILMHFWTSSGLNILPLAKGR
jgi:zinc transporter 1/2/3